MGKIPDPPYRLRPEVERLRREGRSIRQIAEETGVSKWYVETWLKGDCVEAFEEKVCAWPPCRKRFTAYGTQVRKKKYCCVRHRQAHAFARASRGGDASERGSSSPARQTPSHEA